MSDNFDNTENINNPTEIRTPGDKNQQNETRFDSGRKAGDTIIDDPDAGHTPSDDGVPDFKLVGFLVSFSRLSAGEYFPLLLKNNTIGRSESNDIVLPEGSVSSHHARILIVRDDQDLLFSLSLSEEAGSAVRVNGVNLLKFEGQRTLLNPSDVIDVGGYKLFLIVIDSIALKLTQNAKFIHVDDEFAKYNERTDNILNNRYNN